MKKKIVLVSLFAGLSIFSCVKHEVVPAPTPSVDLAAHFTGIINFTDVEYTEDVDGYNGGSSFDQYITTTGLDTTVYWGNMTSDLKTPTIAVGIGGIEWDAATLSTPSLNQFSTFFTTLATEVGGVLPLIPYFKDAKRGFKVVYKDNSGNVWQSTLYHDGNLLENPVTPIESPTFTSMKIESDNSGDYAKFVVNFGCELYRFVNYDTSNPPIPNYDTIRIEEGVFDGWIKR